MKKGLLLCLVCVSVLLPMELIAENGNKVVIIPMGKSSTSTLNTVVRSQVSSRNTANYIGSEIVISSCSVGEVLTGATCSSFSDNFNSSTTNFGVVWTCEIVGNSVLGVALASDLAMSVSKYGPPVTVYAVCASTAASTKMAMKQVEEISPEVNTLQVKMENSLKQMMTEYENKH